MKFEELETQFRHDAGDQAKPYLFSSPDVLRWFNEAEREACIRGDLLREADDPGMCSLPVSAGDAISYDLDARWARITHAEFIPTDGDPITLEIVVDRRTLDQRRRDWRRRTEAPREVLIEGSKIRLGCLPEAAGTLQIEGFRLPLDDMAKDADEPEIDEPHHIWLVQWALKRAFDKPDTETRDPQRSTAAEGRFTAYFGPRKDSDMGQAGEQVPAFNLSIP